MPQLGRFGLTEMAGTCFAVTIYGLLEAKGAARSSFEGHFSVSGREKATGNPRTGLSVTGMADGGKAEHAGRFR